MVDSRLAQVIAKGLKIDVAAVTPALSIGETEKWDSMGHLELVIEIEKAFNIRFTAKTIPILISVKKIEDHLREKGALS